MTKKLLALFLVFVLSIPITLAAEENPVQYTCGDYKYILLEDNSSQIVRYTGNKKNLILPRELDGYIVTSIGNGAFCRCYDLTNIVIPDSITFIGYNAFGSCFSLSNINIPEGVTYIGEAAFNNCSSLTTITIPDSVTTIGTNPFNSCMKLTEIRISPDHPTLASIDGILFDKIKKELICYPCASEFNNYSIPSGVLSIGESAFYNCPTLTSIVIPGSVSLIKQNAFGLCPSLSSIVISEGVTSIGDYAFSNCISLTSIVIPDSVASVGSNPFASCEKLNEIQVSLNHPMFETIDGVLFSKTDKKLVCYPCGLAKKKYTIPNGVKHVGTGAFYGCSDITSINIPEGVTSIENSAFASCSSLSNIFIPQSVTSIGFFMLSSCDPSLTFTVTRNSYAATWCKEKKANYTYPDANNWLLN